MALPGSLAQPTAASTALGAVQRASGAEVSVRPAGHRFRVDADETLLDAGLRAGLRLDYGCSDGSCGLCKARVAGGTTSRLRDERDRTLSDVEREQGYVLLCTRTAASAELAIVALEADGPADLAIQQIACDVEAVAPVASDRLRIELAPRARRRLRFLAGQRVELCDAATDARASYPIASSPCDGAQLVFYVARDPANGFASRLFAGATRRGDPVLVRGPAGDFVLGDARGQVLFVACDLGIAPIRSLLRQAVAVGAAESLSLYWLVTGSRGHFLADECAALDAALERFDYALYHAADPRAGALRVVDAIRVDRFPTQCSVYLAGPAAFVTSAAHGLRANGLPVSQLRVDVVVP